MMGLYRVLLFGPEAATCGKSQVFISCERSTLSLAELRVLLARVEPALSGSLRSARWAVNHAFSPDSASVRPDDEIALIGLVSGG